MKIWKKENFVLLLQSKVKLNECKEYITIYGKVY